MAWTSGTRIKQGKYWIERQLGEGGFGTTYLAKTQAGQRVVIKVPNEQVTNHPDSAKLLEDFLNEALRLARCNHPHVVQVIELIREGKVDGIVMEYIEGQNLLDRLLKQGILPEAEALKYIGQIGQALTVVHNQGLLHRDIKPDNIMVRSANNQAVLIDFGIARKFLPNLTQTQTQMRTPGYAPIEQYDRRAQRGACTDVYALAATLYVLLTGEPLPESQSRALEMSRYRTDSLKPPKTLNPKVSDRTNQAILRGLAIEPQDRPQTMLEWLSLLDASIAPPVVNPPPPAPVQPVRPKIPLQEFSFEVITLNVRGQEIRRETKRAQYFVEDLGNGIQLEMAAIPSGTFLMGSTDGKDEERPQHQVTVPAFYMSKFMVTQAQYKALMGNNPSKFQGLLYWDTNRPVEQVSWQDAELFCDLLSQKTGRSYRLPSEAEWEYACRAGTTTPFHFGGAISSRLANYDGSCFSRYQIKIWGRNRQQTTKVGCFPPNSFGLHDMHGNVSELCKDFYHDNYQGAPTDGSAWIQPPQPPNGWIGHYVSYRVVRGGSWSSSADSCRSDFRHFFSPTTELYLFSSIGFRVASDLA